MQSLKEVYNVTIALKIWAKSGGKHEQDIKVSQKRLEEKKKTE